VSSVFPIYTLVLTEVKYFFGIGWVISITEFPIDLTGRTRYPYERQYFILGIFARWCYAFVNEQILNDQIPTIASISWLILPSGQHLIHYNSQPGACDIVAVSSSLPGQGGRAKEQA
jgi:hypothetical protein